MITIALNRKMCGKPLTGLVLYGIFSNKEIAMPMKSRQLEAFLTERSRKTVSQVDQIMRRLRETGRIASGPRGLHAPDVTPADAAVCLLAVVASPSPGDAGASASLYPSLRGPTGDTLKATLEEVLSPGGRDVTVTLWVDAPFAEVAVPGEVSDLYGRLGGPHPATAFEDQARDCVVIGRGMLASLRKALA